MKKDVRKAMKRAKELERVPLPSKEEIVSIYKEGLEEAEKLRTLLEPEWFVKDIDAQKKGKKPKKARKKTVKKKAKTAQKKKTSTKKKSKKATKRRSQTKKQARNASRPTRKKKSL